MEGARDAHGVERHTVSCGIDEMSASGPRSFIRFWMANDGRDTCWSSIFSIVPLRMIDRCVADVAYRRATTNADADADADEVPDASDASSASDDSPPTLGMFRLARACSLSTSFTLLHVRLLDIPGTRCSVRTGSTKRVLGGVPCTACAVPTGFWELYPWEGY